VKKLLKRAVTAACAAVICISTAIAPAYASAPEVEEAAEVPEIFQYAEGGESTPPADDMTGASDTEWDVGDNVKARISSTNLYFISENGQLYDNWKEIIGDAVLSIESVSVSSGKMFLPEDSSFLFEDMTRLKNINLSGADTSHVNDMAGMFADLPALTQIELSGFNTSAVTDMYQMFYGCSALKRLDFTGFSKKILCTKNYEIHSFF
jgi:surface protein